MVQAAQVMRVRAVVGLLLIVAYGIYGIEAAAVIGLAVVGVAWAATTFWLAAHLRLKRVRALAIALSVVGLVLMLGAITDPSDGGGLLVSLAAAVGGALDIAIAVMLSLRSNQALA